MASFFRRKATPDPIRHDLLTYPVTCKQQAQELVKRLQPTLARLASPDATFVALVTAQAVTITAAFHHAMDPAEIQSTLVPTLAAFIGGAMVNDLACRHLEKIPARRFGFRRG